MAKVYIVHCVDTEGPLYESPETPFVMLKNIFSIDIKPSKENLIKLQKKQIPLKGMEEAVANLLDPHKITTQGNWNDIEKMLKKVTSREFRELLPDSEGKGWIYSWFCMDHVGFTGNNPRRRDAGYHNIFDYYRKLTDCNEYGDIVQFHHHPVPFSGNYNESGTAFWGRDTLDNILTRRIIDRHWFPTAFRPGFHTERPDSHWFLEQWIPFDFGNQSVKGVDTDQPDLSEGRFGDWRRAPKEWGVYHPSHDDYQVPGNCHRWIARCLNMHGRLREITIEDFRDAFKMASEGMDALLCFTNHDYKCMDFEVEKMQMMLKQAASEFPDTPFIYQNAVEGIRRFIEAEDEEVDINMVLTGMETGQRRLEVTANSVFGPQPYLAIKTKMGSYHWDNFDFADQNRWTYVFDNNTFPISAIEKIGVAANSKYGNTEVIICDVEADVYKKYKYNYCI